MGHVFLTGAQGVGKSTILRKTLALLGLTPGGFVTGFDPGRTALYLCPAWEPFSAQPQYRVAQMVDGRPVPHTAAFDAVGPAVLAGCPNAQVLLLDELGRLEGDATAFQAAVRAALGGPVPVLGVVKPNRAGCWLEGLDINPITVTEENRDALPQWLAWGICP